MGNVMMRSVRRAAANNGNTAAICAAAADLALRGRAIEAIAGYRQAIALTPGFAKAHTSLGNLLFEQGRLEEALAHLRRAISCAPQLAEPHNSLGNIMKRRGMMAGAAQLYAQAVALDPAYAEARNNLGQALVALRRTVEGITHFREALRIKPCFVDARLNLASALIDIEALADARSELERAWHERDAAAFPLPRLGMLFARCGLHDEASGCFSTHASLCPGERDAMASLLAWIGTAPRPPAGNAGATTAATSSLS
jgi:tetratricopeptide (TPR) repeat protein